MDKSIFYDYHPLLSRNALFNFIVSNRGAGKTYGALKQGIKKFLRKKRKFIYLRRYKTEFVGFDKILNPLRDDPDFQDVDWEIKGQNIYINDELAGYGVALSTALTKKSQSFHDVDLIIFDEFVIDSKVIHYMSNEVTAFLEFYETVARLRDNVVVLFISNNVSVVNPYFLYWNIKPNPNKRFTKFGHMLVDFYKNKDFIEEKYKTRFGQIIKGTKYGDYAVENESLKDNLNFVEKKTGDAKYTLSVTYNQYTYGFWTDYKRGLIFVSLDHDPTHPIKYTLSHAEHGLNYMLIQSLGKSPHLKTVVNAYESGLMRFEDMRIKNQFIEIMGVLRA